MNFARGFVAYGGDGCCCCCCYSGCDAVVAVSVSVEEYGEYGEQQQSQQQEEEQEGEKGDEEEEPSWSFGVVAQRSVSEK